MSIDPFQKLKILGSQSSCILLSCIQRQVRQASHAPVAKLADLEAAFMAARQWAEIPFHVLCVGTILCWLL